MNYKEAAEKLKNNLKITGDYGKVILLPFYIKSLVVAPKKGDLKETMDVYSECKFNGYDNKNALITLGLFSTDLDVFIIAIEGGSYIIKPLDDYLNELDNESKS
ncbi:MAG TPA: hypothetical protein PK431_14725 [Chitinophagales bacterium]|nr:hypothetical protein [Chitinophagales bacterium]